MKSRLGFTFVEIILALGMGVIIVVVVSRFATTISDLEGLVNDKLSVQQDLAQALNPLATEIRSAAPSELGAYPIAAASSTEFTFYSDINQNGVIDRVRYFFGTSTLQKGTIEPTGLPLAYVTSSEVVVPVVTGVKIGSSTFQYFDASATSTDTPLSIPINLSDIRFVKVTVTADVTSSTPRPTTYSQTITIRNLRSN
ncbi:MAG: hypothetical protein KGZ30_04495 [Anaplasmataceae bacterium]|nr:hypothetical protein [Anaplasmataceae bacterium]